MGALVGHGLWEVSIIKKSSVTISIGGLEMQCRCGGYVAWMLLQIISEARVRDLPCGNRAPLLTGTTWWSRMNGAWNSGHFPVCYSDSWHCFLDFLFHSDPKWNFARACQSLEDKARQAASARQRFVFWRGYVKKQQTNARSLKIQKQLTCKKKGGGD